MARVDGRGREANPYSSIGPCPECGKQCYETRAAARREAKRIHPGERLNAYQCGLWWHIGHNRVWRASRDHHQQKVLKGAH